MEAIDGSNTRSEAPTFINGRTGFPPRTPISQDPFVGMHEHIEFFKQQIEENNQKIKRLTEDNTRLETENKNLKSRINDLERFGTSKPLVLELKKACENFLNYEADNGVSNNSNNDIVPWHFHHRLPNYQSPSVEGTCPKLMHMFNECQSTSRRLKSRAQLGNSVNPPSSVSPMTSQSPTPAEDASSNVATSGDMSMESADMNQFTPPNTDVEAIEQAPQEQHHSHYSSMLQPQEMVVAGPQSGISMNGINGVNGTNGGMQNNRRNYTNNMNKPKKPFLLFVSWQGGTMTQQTLRDLFRGIDIKEIRPSQTKSFAHIDVHSNEGMNRAIAEYNGKQHAGYGTLRVEKGKPKVPGAHIEKPQNQQGPQQNNRRNDYQNKSNYSPNGIMNHGNGSQSQLDAIEKWQNFSASPDTDQKPGAGQPSLTNSIESKSNGED